MTIPSSSQMRAAARLLARAARRRHALALPHVVALAPVAAAAFTTPLRLRRHATTPPPPTPIDDATYHAAADATLADLTEALEGWVEAGPAAAVLGVDADVEYATGVLTLRLGDGRGTYVLNKQAPNKQIWVSSPVR